MSSTKVVVVGAGPVGSLAALYAAQRGYEVEIYELRNGMEIPRNIEACHTIQSVACIMCRQPLCAVPGPWAGCCHWPFSSTLTTAFAPDSLLTDDWQT